MIPRNTKQVKKVMTSLRYHGNSDVIETWIVVNVKLWQTFSDIFVNGDVVNAQTWEVSISRKIQSSHLNLRKELIAFFSACKPVSY